MNFAISIVTSVFLAVGSWIYLNLSKVSEGNENQAIKDRLLSNKKLLIYSVCAMFVLIGLAIELNLVFKSNTLVANLKVLTLLAILITACITDIRNRTIPNVLILAGVVFRIVYAVIEVATLGSRYFAILKNDGIALLVAAVLFLLCALVVKNGVGMGDVKLVLVMGLFQGFTSMVSSLFVSMIVAFVVAIVLLVSKKKGRKDSMEFAPALLLGTLISVVLTGC